MCFKLSGKVFLIIISVEILIKMEVIKWNVRGFDFNVKKCDCFEKLLNVFFRYNCLNCLGKCEEDFFMLKCYLKNLLKGKFLFFFNIVIK